MRIHIGHHFFGTGNIGDDWMMAGFLEAWRRHGDGAALSCVSMAALESQQRRFPEVDWLPDTVGARRFAIRSCDAWLGLGDSPFQTDCGPWMAEHLEQERLWCREMGKPMDFLGVGMNNRDALDDTRLRMVAQEARRIWTRDAGTLEQLRKHVPEEKLRAGADLAHLWFSTQPKSTAGTGSRSIDWLLHFEEVSQFDANVLEKLIDQQPEATHHWLVQEVRVLPGSEQENYQKLSPSLQQRLSLCLPDYQSSSTSSLGAAWPVSETVVTSRFHGALWAAWNGARLVVLVRNDKLRHAVDTLGCISVDGVTDAEKMNAALSQCRIVPTELLKKQSDTAERMCREYFSQARSHLPRPEITAKAPLPRGDGMHAKTIASPPISGYSPARSMFKLFSRKKQEVPREPLLSAEDVERFRTQGFIGPFRAFAPEEMPAISKVIREQVLATPTPHSPYPHLVRHLDSATVNRLCNAPAIVGRMQELYGPDLLVWYSMLFDKPPARPENPEEYPWHQDAFNWKLEPMITLSAWLAITPSSVQHGCVELVPATHKREVPMIHSADNKFSSWFGGRIADPSQFDESKRVAMPLKAGEFFIFNERTLHRSGMNVTDENRLGLSIRVTLPLVKTYERWPVLSLSGKDTLRANPHAEPPAGEPTLDAWPGGLPSAENFSFVPGGNVPGLGWHQPESDATSSFCWMGPQRESWLELQLASEKASQFRCVIRHAPAPHLLEYLQVFVNDQPLNIKREDSPSGQVLSCRIPGKLMKGRNKRVRFTFRVPETVRWCDLNPQAKDTRRIGVAVGPLSLVPESV